MVARPFIKCAGGKRKHPVIHRIVELLPDNWDTYLEPMLGGGAVFFSLHERGFLEDKKVILSDLDETLMALYQAVRDEPDQVWMEADLERVTVAKQRTVEKQKEWYNLARSLWNRGDERHPGIRLYLQHACFNGIFRVNRKGDMNTPPRDNLKDVKIPAIEDLQHVSLALRNAELHAWHIKQLFSANIVTDQTVIYLDPPYDGGWVDYTRNGFTEEDQVAVIAAANAWAELGARVVYSNADTPFIRAALAQFWPAGTIEDVYGARSCACDGDKRTPAPEVLVHNHT
jgi:DNA adenine methylase